MLNASFDQAISAHINWLVRFEHVLLGLDRERFDPQHISDVTLCEFGRWLQANPDFTSNHDLAEQVRTLHQRFHAQAALIAAQLQSFDNRDVIRAHWQHLSELSGELVEVLYNIRALNACPLGLLQRTA